MDGIQIDEQRDLMPHIITGQIVTGQIVTGQIVTGQINYSFIDTIL